jgi:hypothetical protein
MLAYLAHWLVHHLAAHPVERIYLIDLAKFYGARLAAAL